MVTTVDDPLFVDTNGLLYATDIDSPWHTLATAALNAARRGGVELVISPQVINEYLAVSTRPGIGPALSRVEILENIQTFLTEFTLLPEDRTVARALFALVQTFAVSGRQVHDANIVATMQAHGINRLLTHNEADFARYAGIITVVPLTSFR